MNLHNNNSRGFTLVELIVVVAVVGLLLSIAVPTYMHVIDRARLTSSIAALNMVKLELEAYAAGKQGYPLTIDFTNFTDQDGDPVLSSSSRDNIRNKIYSWEKYTREGDSYTLTARGNDSEHTVLTLTPAGISH